jgi:hypothetical protein
MKRGKRERIYEMSAAVVSTLSFRGPNLEEKYISDSKIPTTNIL